MQTIHVALDRDSFQEMNRFVDKAFEQATKIGSLEYDIDIYEDHFEVRARSGQTNLTYDQLYSLQADDKYFYLFLYATQLDIVPKALCTDETRAILESHLRVR